MQNTSKIQEEEEGEKDGETQKASVSAALADPAGMPATFGMCFVMKSAKGQIVISGGAHFFFFCFV